MSTKQPMPGPGQFQWNRGAWFGSLFGCTAWLLPTGLTFLDRNPLLGTPNIGILWLAIFMLLNALGFWLWNRRDRVEPYRAIQFQLLACGIGGLIAIGSIDVLQWRMGLPTLSTRGWRLYMEEDRDHQRRQIYLYLLLGIPVLMGWFALLESGARKARAKPASAQAIESQPRADA